MTGERTWARALYNYRWMPQTDPYGRGAPPPSITPVCRLTMTRSIKTPRFCPACACPSAPHFGTMGLAPVEADYVSSIPPSYFGGNIDNWRIGKGGTMYYPVAVQGGLLSAGDSRTPPRATPNWPAPR